MIPYNQTITQGKMKITKKYIGLLLAGTLLVLGSCSKEWLEPEPLSFFAPENVYLDEAGFESLLITMRKNLKAEYYGTFNYSTAEFAPTDLGIAGYVPDFSINT